MTMLNFLMRILFIENRDTERKDIMIPASELGINLYQFVTLLPHMTSLCILIVLLISDSVLLSLLWKWGKQGQKNSIFQPTLLSQSSHQGRCQVLVNYQVKRRDNSEAEFYTGVTVGPFKTRYYGHSYDLRKYVWELKDNGIGYDIYCKSLPRGGGSTSPPGLDRPA